MRQHDLSPLHSLCVDKDELLSWHENNHEWRHYSGINWDAEYRLLLYTSRANSSLNELVENFFTLSIYNVWLNRD